MESIYGYNLVHHGDCCFFRLFSKITIIEFYSINHLHFYFIISVLKVSFHNLQFSRLFVYVLQASIAESNQALESIQNTKIEIFRSKFRL